MLTLFSFSAALSLSLSFSLVPSEQYRDTTEKKNAFLATKSSRDSRSRFITNRNRRVSEGERGMRAGLPPHGQTTGAAQAAKKIVVAGSGHGSLEGEALGACSSAWSRRARRRYSRPPRTALRRRNRHACVRVGRIAQPMGWGVCVCDMERERGAPTLAYVGSLRWSWKDMECWT